MINFNLHRIFLSEGRTLEAINGLIDDFNDVLLSDSSKEIENQYNIAISFKARLNDLLDKEIKGTEHSSILGVEKAKLVSDILNFLSRLNSLDYSAYNKIARKVSKSDENYSFDFFLCYSTLDSLEASKIANRLRQEGYNVFFSTDSLSSQVGLSYTDKIQFAVIESKNFVLLCTPNSMVSKWVKSEWQLFFTSLNESIDQRRLIVLQGNNFSFDLVPPILRNLQISKNVDSLISQIQKVNSTDGGNLKKKKNKVVPEKKKNVTTYKIVGFIITLLSFSLLVIGNIALLLIGFLVRKGVINIMNDSDMNKSLGGFIVISNLILAIVGIIILSFNNL